MIQFGTNRLSTHIAYSSPGYKYTANPPPKTLHTMGPKISQVSGKKIKRQVRRTDKYIMKTGGERDEKKRMAGLVVSTAVSQWGRTEGPKMMDDGEMKGERERDNLRTSGMSAQKW